jgi:hypothetical protein
LQIVLQLRRNIAKSGKNILCDIFCRVV